MKKGSRTLFICETDYQIINSINIKLNMLKEDEADILISNYRDGIIGLSERLENLGIFKNVYFFKGRRVRKHLRILELLKDCKQLFKRNSLNDVSKHLKSVLLGYYSKNSNKINCCLTKNKFIDLYEYNHVFGFTLNSLFTYVNNYILKEENECIFSCIDEGVGSYTNAAIDFSLVKINDVYLYEPELAIYYNQFNDIKKIPKIDKEDKYIVGVLNYLFRFKRENIVDLRNKIIFFDQCFSSSNKSENKWYKSVFFYKNAKCASEDSIKFNIQKYLFREVIECFKNDKIFVKLHPRTRDANVSVYKNSNIIFLENKKIPWELFCLNCNVDNSIWITVNSSAVHTYDFTINSKNKKICIYGIGLYDIGNENKDEYNMFIKKYKIKNSSVIILNKKNSLRKLLESGDIGECL